MISIKHFCVEIYIFSLNYYFSLNVKFKIKLNIYLFCYRDLLDQQSFLNHQWKLIHKMNPIWTQSQQQDSYTPSSPQSKKK